MRPLTNQIDEPRNEEKDELYDTQDGHAYPMVGPDGTLSPSTGLTYSSCPDGIIPPEFSASVSEREYEAYCDRNPLYQHTFARYVEDLWVIHARELASDVIPDAELPRLPSVINAAEFHQFDVQAAYWQSVRPDTSLQQESVPLGMPQSARSEREAYFARMHDLTGVTARSRSPSSSSASSVPDLEAGPSPVADPPRIGVVGLDWQSQPQRTVALASDPVLPAAPKSRVVPPGNASTAFARSAVRRQGVITTSTEERETQLENRRQRSGFLPGFKKGFLD